MLIDDASRKDIHSKLVKCLLIIEQMRHEAAALASHSDANESEEVNKVYRRLRLWAQPDRQEQYNAKILNAYLELVRSGEKKITEEDLRARLGDELWFTPNFNQMRAISDRNHGKVFDVHGQYLSIWPPVRSAVQEYERSVFDGV